MTNTQAHSGVDVRPQSVTARLRSVRPALSEAEQRVAAFFVQHAEAAISLPVKVLAERINVSEATIVRCCQSLGFRGLRDLKLALAAETAAPAGIIREDVATSDSVATIAQKVLHADIQAIADTLALLDLAALEHATTALAAAPRVEFYGVGSSIPIVLDAAYRFLRIGMAATALTDPYMQLVAAAQLTAGCVAFGITHSGRSPEIVDALRHASAAGATCIVLTSVATAAVVRYAHIVLTTPRFGTLLQHESLTSRIAHLSVMDALHVAVSAQRFDHTLEAMARNRAIFADRT